MAADRKGKYTIDDSERKRQLEKQYKEKKSLPIGGKSAKMGVPYPFNHNEKTRKAAEGAYDKIMNLKEEELEDINKRNKWKGSIGG